MEHIYDFTVPLFVKQLNGLVTVLDKAEQFAKEHNISEADFLKEALWPDMFPLVKQVQVATDNAKGAAARLAGLEVPVYEDTEQTFAELKSRIHKTLGFLASVERESFAEAQTRQIRLPYFPEGKYLSGFDYAREYALPNFFFHVTTAYGIVRHKGVLIGKYDYINGLSFKDFEEHAL